VRHGFGVSRTLDIYYRGWWNNGMRHGHGLARNLAQNETYLGGWREGLRHGYGTFTSPEASYTGDWVKDMRHGHGTLRSLSGGDAYIGQWSSDMMHGRGRTYVNYDPHTMVTRTTSSNSNSLLVYDGGMARGLRQGYGTYWPPESHVAIYAGMWHKDLLHGQGRWVCESYRVKLYNGYNTEVKFDAQNEAENLLWYVGEWRNGKRHGYGTFSSVDGQYNYSGEWRNDARHGHGRETIDGVGAYVGEFENGVYSGKGVWTGLYGVYASGWWAQGQLVDMDALSLRNRLCVCGLVGLVLGLASMVQVTVAPKVTAKTAADQQQKQQKQTQKIVAVRHILVAPWNQKRLVA